MKTTAIFAELLIIGVMTILLFFIVFSIAVGTQWCPTLSAFIKGANLLMSVLVLALAYIIGIIADESCDSITRPLENRVIKRVFDDNGKKAWEFQARALLKSSEAATGLEYMRGRIRILRAIVVIAPLATGLSVAEILLRGTFFGSLKLGSITLVAIVGSLLSASAFFTYHHLTDNYWRRVKEFGQKEKEEYN